MKWKSFIKNVSSDYHFTHPATFKDMRVIKEKLNVNLPKELEDLLRETNGVYDQFDCHFIWPIHKIIEENLYYRGWEDFKDIYMPFDHLLFFSDAGNGDLFGYAILNGHIHHEDIYVWKHEDDSRTWIASSLKEFIEGWLAGKISV
ncbi:SMI1/KNR4 family protein [Planococcus liqunii]|uniref:SMI1/KNR4 family protein n=1 Tax=Planococcus liqunii TaxID=3058394 RepID=UPI00262D0608|nr:SMI1/KNR4 family protein [Planococcus sp. N056]WKA52820.1 SMI1/KNR4 family protein [Planococcus sp. N056]